MSGLGFSQEFLNAYIKANPKYLKEQYSAPSPPPQPRPPTSSINNKSKKKK
jgi:hypothetical protein